MWIIALILLTGSLTDAASMSRKGVRVIRQGVVLLTDDDQRRLLLDAHLRCLVTMNSTQPLDTPHCPRVWDGIMCWPDSPVDTLFTQPCPDHINLFKLDGFAARECTESGDWFVNPFTNRTWTNYTDCVGHIDTAPQLIEEHMHSLRVVYTTGYGVSLISLVVAVIIMLSIKKLHCPRNTVHINLFISFILRAAISFLKESLMTNGIGLAIDVKYDKYNRPIFTEGPHVACKLLLSLFMYSLSANYMWIFVEGLYLHMLIFVSVFSENSSVLWYIVLGWVSPLTFVVPWVLVRVTLDDTLCWNTYDETKTYLKWIIEGPITLSILINFLLFLNLVRVLFTKLQASGVQEARALRYKKLAKSTLVLIPLFGVHYVVLLWVQQGKVSEKLELAKLYFEMFFNSFQGFIVAILFCYMNGEVQGELKKKWERWRLTRGGPEGTRRLAHRASWQSCATTVTRAPLARGNLHVINPQDRNKRLKDTVMDEHDLQLTSTLNGRTNGAVSSDPDETKPMI